MTFVTKEMHRKFHEVIKAWDREEPLIFSVCVRAFKAEALISFSEMIF